MLVLGIDAGGTSTRARLVDGHGQRLAAATGPGANVNSSADAQRALGGVLADVAGGRSVDVLVLGAAGAVAGRGRTERALRRALDAAGVQARETIVVSDVETAYAAGAVEPAGTVLVAGTGAVAAQLRDFRVVRRRDGHGYLLGDRGSAVWVGLAAVRAVLAAAEESAAPTALHEPVLAALAAPPFVDAVPSDDPVRADDRERADDPVRAVLGAVYGGPPARIGLLAPVVAAVAAAGDAVALAIVDAAVSALVATTGAARVGAPATAPLVLTGGLATGAGVFGTRLRAALLAAFAIEPAVVHDASAGAVALALRSLDVDAATIAALVGPDVR